MLFNSIEFLIFFPVVALFYYVIPQRARWVWLLVASYFFYMSWNPEYALLIGISTVTTWAGGILIRACAKSPGVKGGRAGKLWLAGCIICNLGILFFFKYYNFTVASIGKITGRFGVVPPAFDVILPVGISFYTFQALGYLIDVYRGDVEPERNPFRYALFISFFPQLVAGPIERSGNLLRQMHERHAFDPQRVKDGLLLMGWGFFQKMVIADRIAILVTDVYDHYPNYTGLQIAVATVLFAFQIYCDFAGYSDIAVGAARVMGFDLMKNFRSPYYAETVGQFWRSWHISLTTWFRDYIYIPLGGNRCGRLRKYRNLLATFAISGLWHGARWNYVAWGLMNGIYQVAGDITKSWRMGFQKRLGIRTECWSYRLFRKLVTFALVDFAWLFFRAEGFQVALGMLRHGISSFGITSMLDSQTLLGIHTMALDEKDFFVMLVGLAILMAVDGFRKRMDLKAALAGQNLIFRWIVYYALIFTVLIFGIYGPAYDASAFIYFQF